MSIRRRTPRIALAALLATVALTATACASSPGAGVSASPSSSDSAAPTESVSATPTPEPTTAFPADCDAVYSAAMRATLESTVPPLNDPGVTMLSSQNANSLDLLASGIPTLRCTWGVPSEYGIATNVSQIDAAQAGALRESLLQAGFSEEAASGGSIYRLEQRMVTQDDALVTLGEVQYVGEGRWVSTRWIDADIPGYTEDIVATVWG